VGAVSLRRRIEVTTPRHRHLHGILREISTSFGQPISVLDAGCGTGRYFHCLENVALLVGMDLSPEMLAAARHPVRRDSVAARRVQLLCQNICRACFPAGTFDFVYSLGMFGNGCPVTL
jgi:SAM-dependent methyltransferase